MKHEGGDGAFKVQWFGLIQNDWAWYWGDGDSDTATALGDPLNPASSSAASASVRPARCTGMSSGGPSWTSRAATWRSPTCGSSSRTAPSGTSASAA